MADKVIPPPQGPPDPGASTKEMPPLNPVPVMPGPGDSVGEVQPLNPVPAVLGPGDGEGAEFETLVMPPPGPGDLNVPRPAIRRRVRSAPNVEKKAE